MLSLPKQFLLFFFFLFVCSFLFESICILFLGMESQCFICQALLLHLFLLNLFHLFYHFFLLHQLLRLFCFAYFLFLLDFILICPTQFCLYSTLIISVHTIQLPIIRNLNISSKLSFFICALDLLLIVSTAVMNMYAKTFFCLERKSLSLVRMFNSGIRMLFMMGIIKF